MPLCDHCKSEQNLYPVFGSEYTELFHICMQCQTNTFLCYHCQQLRDNEEYVNGYCLRHTKYNKETSDRITALENALQTIKDMLGI